MHHLNLAYPGHLTTALVPDLIVMVGGMLLLLRCAWGAESQWRSHTVAVESIGVCVFAMIAIVVFMAMHVTATNGAIAVDNFRWATDLIVLLAAIIAIALSIDYNRRERLVTAEAHVLVLFATSGMMLLAGARDLIIVFLGVELMSVAVYVLAGFNRRSLRASEAALKYFLLGAFSSAFLLYGIALVFGATGSLNLLTIGERVTSETVNGSLLLIGISLLLVGFAFKVAAAPFHMWTPDVYEGAPTPYTAYMAAAVKAAAFAAFLRVWLEAFAPARAQWHMALWWLAIVTMVVGNVIALSQQNIKRLLAYSSIAHAGYLLVAVVAGSPAGSSAFIFYLIAYTLATMGAFAVVIALEHSGERNQNVADYAGLWTVRPWLAIAMAVFMLALLGFPIVGGMGFFAKWYVLQAALEQSQNIIAVVLVLTSVISCGYYLYVVMVMFMRPRAEGAAVPARVPSITGFVIGATAAVLIVFGVYPGPAVLFARHTTLNMPGAYPPASGAPVRQPRLPPAGTRLRPTAGGPSSTAPSTAPSTAISSAH